MTRLSLALLWLRAHWRWWFGVVLAGIGAGMLIRRKDARRIARGSIGLAIHKASVAQAEADLGAGKAHLVEMALIRKRVEDAHGVAARVELDRQSVLSGMVLDDALLEMRQRAKELGL